MAKYVLIEFDDDGSADKFVKDTQAEKYVYGDIGGHLENMYEVPVIVRAVFRKPTKFCECVGNIKSRGFSRGKKYGWWVCNKCGRPTRSWGRGDHWFLALGHNLLPISARAPEYRGDGIFARSIKPCPECDTPLVVQVGHATCRTYCPKCEKDV